MNSKKIGFVLIIFGLILVVATGSYAAFGPSVSGTVIDSSTGKPLRSTVRIGSKTIDTGTTGKFTFRGLPQKINLKITAKNHGEVERVVRLELATDKDLGKVKLANDVVLQGSVIENSISPKKIKDLTITIGNKEFNVDGDEFEIVGVERGEQNVKVEADGFESFERVGDIKKGTNTMAVTLSLTPEETMKRWFRAEDTGDFDKAYKYAHPDMETIFNKDAYLNDRKSSNEKGIAIESLKLNGAVIISEWKLPLNNKTYVGVAELDTLIMFKGKTSESANSDASDPNKLVGKSHLVKVDGKWKMFPQPYGE